jgi:hypothetical protein
MLLFPASCHAGDVEVAPLSDATLKMAQWGQSCPPCGLPAVSIGCGRKCGRGRGSGGMGWGGSVGVNECGREHTGWRGVQWPPRFGCGRSSSTPRDRTWLRSPATRNARRVHGADLLTVLVVRPLRISRGNRRVVPANGQSATKSLPTPLCPLLPNSPQLPPIALPFSPGVMLDPICRIGPHLTLLATIPSLSRVTAFPCDNPDLTAP